MMNLREYADPHDLRYEPKVAYFTPHYLSIQAYDDLRLFANDSFMVPFSIEDQTATTLDRSPFGSYLGHNEGRYDQFQQFESEVFSSLKTHDCKELIVKHPSPIYPDYVDKDWLTKVGYTLLFEDVNQHVPLSPDWENGIHKMQLRKLRSLRDEGFEFKVVPHSELKVMHQFLSVCRQSQGLEINVSYEKLKSLMEKLPDSYDIFAVSRENKISAVCITVRATATRAYYYLAGTSPLFRSKSPMVLLIAGMIEHYRNQGFEIFDLGVSSHQGRPQETLRLFKNRMGATETIKPSFIKTLQ